MAGISMRGAMKSIQNQLAIQDADAALSPVFWSVLAAMCAIIGFLTKWWLLLNTRIGNLEEDRIVFAMHLPFGAVHLSVTTCFLLVMMVVCFGPYGKRSKIFMCTSTVLAMVLYTLGMLGMQELLLSAHGK